MDSTIIDGCYTVNENGCWVWKNSTNQCGYGRKRHRGFTWLAHRLSWTIKNGDIPDGLNVCHKCDNPACINPDHLFLGTQHDNINDMVAKGRGRHGRKKNLTKTQRDTIKVIYHRYPRSTEGLAKFLARWFGVPVNAIYRYK